MKQAIITSKYNFNGAYLSRPAKIVLVVIISGIIISMAVSFVRYIILKNFVTKIPVDGLKAVDVRTR